MTPVVRIQPGDFDVGAEIAALARGCRDAGAIVQFVGHVRGEDGVTALTLEHYPGMTEAQILRIAQGAAARWPLLGMRIVHRIGRLVPGERIVLAAVASAHRHAAFEAGAFLIDYLKTEAPFWKLEERGAAQIWVEAKVADEDARMRWRE